MNSRNPYSKNENGFIFVVLCLGLAVLACAGVVITSSTTGRWQGSRQIQSEVTQSQNYRDILKVGNAIAQAIRDNTDPNLPPTPRCSPTPATSPYETQKFTTSTLATLGGTIELNGYWVRCTTIPATAGNPIKYRITLGKNP